ncbi:site-specific DNA-methyltransferase [Actinomadura sp. NPDC049382]|uniref:DNA-methyltransferase n=1 Tax=Actinomadura sp. NPDC049382 TaxID=3158220 RepID=UPI00343D1BA4
MTAPYWEDDAVALYLGDCLDVLRTLPDASVDAVVTDPPAGISFMGRDWDGDLGGRGRWIAWHADRLAEAVRVLKPGGHALVWALPRTSHWTAMAVEDAGLEIRDCVTHLFGSGFPKSHDVGKAIDKAAGAERPVIGVAADFAQDGAGRRTDGSHLVPHGHQGGHGYGDRWSAPVTAPATEEAARWDGWGTALKPAAEHWWLARRPLAGTVAANVLEHGTGALNIDGCRTAAGQDYRDKCASVVGLDSNRNGDAYGDWPGARTDSAHQAGRWPTNVVLSHPPIMVDGEVVGDACASGCVDGCPVAELDRQSGITTSLGGSRGAGGQHGAYSPINAQHDLKPGFGDTGGASRFFPTFRYEAKAPASERPKLPDGTAWPTVKPVALMRWLVRLVTPPNGVVLDPFAGTGTTAEAAVTEGFRALLIERDPQAAELIKTRLAKPIAPVLDFEGERT